MNVERLNALDDAQAKTELLRCCASRHWAEEMARLRPFPSAAAALAAADAVWAGLGREDWLEAFAGHPRIGDIASLRAKYGDTRALAEGEQSGVRGASEETLQGLARGNRDYEARFGHLFIVCATGKTAEEMLALLRARLGNAPAAELPVAAAEQAKITRLRLEGLT